MEQVWKFALRGESEQRVTMPAFAKPLSVQLQHGAPYVLAQVDPAMPATEYTFFVVPTGGTVPEDAKYLGTVQVAGGDYIFHVYHDRTGAD